MADAGLWNVQPGAGRIPRFALKDETSPVWTVATFAEGVTATDLSALIGDPTDEEEG